MNYFQNTIFTKRIVIVVLFAIVSLILWNTYIFFQRFKAEERLKMELFAAALNEINTTDLDTNMNLYLKILENFAKVQSLVVDSDGNITQVGNYDEEKLKNPEYVKQQLEIMKSQNNPIEINHEKFQTQYVYYKNSDLLTKLTYYPLALILILLLFLTVIHMLFSSNKIAEQNKLWTGMAKETAHQIGTPLSSLLGWLEILKTEEVATEYIPEMEKDIERLNSIANRFSKIGSKPELHKQDIVACTKNILDYFEKRSSKKVHFNFKTNSTVCFAKVNEELFGWVIENLIKNGIDAMQGKGRIDVSINSMNTKVVIVVSDTGKGIYKRQFKQIFKPGFTTKKRGWGLGLSLSKRIIEEYHKGRISVLKSEKNIGSSFQIQLQTV